MEQKRIYINNSNSSILINDIITQAVLYNKYNITINAIIETPGFKNIELYYYWTIDEDLNILDTSYIRYHLKGVNIDWNNVDRILSNLALEQLHDKILYDKFNKMNI